METLDYVHDRIQAAASQGFGSHSGLPLPSFETNHFLVSQIVDPDDADRLLRSTAFESFLLSLKLDRSGFTEEGKFSEFEENLNSISTLVRPFVDQATVGLLIEGLDNNPMGFSPSAPVSSLQWCLISYAQEEVAVRDFLYSGPRIAHDLMVVIEAGHLPVGWRARPSSGELLVF